MRIDVHAHAQPPEYLQALVDSGRFAVERGPENEFIIKERGARFLTVRQDMYQPNLAVEDMDRTGVDMQILSLTTPNVYFLAGQAAVDLATLTNDYLASVVQQHPTRFRALASIPLTADIDSAIAELARCMDQLAMPGFIIGANIDGVPLDDPRFDPFYEEANRRGALMFVHPMIPPGMELMNQYALGPLVGFMFDTTLAIARLIYSNFFGRFLGINVVAGNLGGAAPFLTGRLDIGWQRYPECQDITRPPSEVIERMYFDTVSGSEAALRCAIEAVGEDHILFGTDYPNLTGDIANAIANVESSVSRRHRSHILGDTAAKLYGIAR